MKKILTLLSIAGLFVLAVTAFASPEIVPALTSLTASHVDIPTITLASGLALLGPGQLEAEAQKLSRYNGGLSFYTGMDDDLLSFDGDIRSFAQELDKNLDKQFTVSIVNANAAARTTILYGGYYLGNTTLAPGQIVEGAYNDVNGAAGLTGATGEAKSIQELSLFLNYCPTRLLALKIQSTVPGQLNKNLFYQRNNPFKTEENQTIRPKNFINQDTNQNDQVTFPVDVQLDALSKFSYDIVGSSTNYVTFFFGASLNIMEALEKKAAKAGMNIAVAGKTKVVAAQRAFGGRR